MKNPRKDLIHVLSCSLTYKCGILNQRGAGKDLCTDPRRGDEYSNGKIAGWKTPIEISYNLKENKPKIM